MSAFIRTGTCGNFSYKNSLVALALHLKGHKIFTRDSVD